MFITYTSSDEVIVCTPETEKDTIQSYFTEGDRHMEDYDRAVHEDGSISIRPYMKVW